jgi:Spy/CpxP family protein refolding chaperone
MKTWTGVAFLVTLAALPSLGAAQPFDDGPGGRRGGPPPFLAELVPPEVVMRNQSDLDLSEDQKKAIMAAMRETRDSVDPVRWKLEEEQGELAELVRAPEVDEAALLAQADTVMDLEKELKKSHLLLLVKIKSVLTPEQRQKAQSLKRRHRTLHRRDAGRGDGGGPP